jgi:hypothetical protein
MVISKSSEEGLFKVRTGDKYGFIDFSGKVAIPVEYDFCEDFENGFAMVMEKDKWGAIDKSGKKLIESNYEYQEVKSLLKQKRSND